jgi:hypothetical protein
MKHKYYSTHIKPNKCIRQNLFNLNNEKILWTLVTVSGGGGSGWDQNQSIPDFVRGYNKLAMV